MTSAEINQIKGDIRSNKSKVDKLKHQREVDAKNIMTLTERVQNLKESVKKVAKINYAIFLSLLLNITGTIILFIIK